ncbi:hypothetical protein HDU99_006270, partial [Rhizoclosmatium hyalinum]
MSKPKNGTQYFEFLCLQVRHKTAAEAFKSLSSSEFLFWFTIQDYGNQTDFIARLYQGVFMMSEISNISDYNTILMLSESILAFLNATDLYAYRNVANAVNLWINFYD